MISVLVALPWDGFVTVPFFTILFECCWVTLLENVTVLATPLFSPNITVLPLVTKLLLAMLFVPITLITLFGYCLHF